MDCIGALTGVTGLSRTEQKKHKQKIGIEEEYRRSNKGIEKKMNS